MLTVLKQRQVDYLVLLEGDVIEEVERLDGRP